MAWQVCGVTIGDEVERLDDDGVMESSQEKRKHETYPPQVEAAKWVCPRR